MRIYEQADRGREEGTFIYSWVLDASYRIKKTLPGWKWVRGKPTGAYVTNDRALALATAQRFGLTIGTNNTHQTLNAPGDLYSR